MLLRATNHWCTWTGCLNNMCLSLSLLDFAILLQSVRKHITERESENFEYQTDFMQFFQELCNNRKITKSAIITSDKFMLDVRRNPRCIPKNTPNTDAVAQIWKRLFSYFSFYVFSTKKRIFIFVQRYYIQKFIYFSNLKYF